MNVIYAKPPSNNKLANAQVIAIPYIIFYLLMQVVIFSLTNQRNKKGHYFFNNKSFIHIKRRSYPSMLDRLSIRLIYSSGFKVGKPSAEATATHITAEELPLLAIV